MNNLFETVVRSVKFIIAIAAAALVIYRGNTYLDPHGAGMLVPVMCIVFGMLVIGTTLAMTFKPQPPEAEIA